MQQLKPWFRILVIVDAILFLVGGAVIFFYGSADGGWWSFAAFLGTSAVLAVAIGIMYLWQMRG